MVKRFLEATSTIDKPTFEGSNVVPLKVANTVVMHPSLTSLAKTPVGIVF